MAAEERGHWLSGRNLRLLLTIALLADTLSRLTSYAFSFVDRGEVVSAFGGAQVQEEILYSQSRASGDAPLLRLHKTDADYAAAAEADLVRVEDMYFGVKREELTIPKVTTCPAIKPLEEVYFLHMRKAGGSTVRLNVLAPLTALKRTTFEEYHPLDKRVLAHSNQTSAVNIRKPIDRIVSKYESEGGYGQVSKFNGSPWRFTFKEWYHMSRVYANDKNGVRKWTRIKGLLMLYKPNYYLERLTGNATCGQANLDRAIGVLNEFDLFFMTERLNDESFQKYASLRLGYKVNTKKRQWYGAEMDKTIKLKKQLREEVLQENKHLIRLMEIENACDYRIYEYVNSLVDRCIEEDRNRLAPTNSKPRVADSVSAP